MDRKNSHLADNPESIAAVNAALSRINSAGRDFIEEEVQFDHTVGMTTCVTTTGDDIVEFLQRKNRNGLSRMVFNRDPEPCDKVFVVLKKSGPSEYVLITGFVGAKPHPELFDENAFARKDDPDKAFEEASIFWKDHALICNDDEAKTLIEQRWQAIVNDIGNCLFGSDPGEY